MQQKFHNGDSILLNDGSSPKTIVNDKLGEDEKHIFFNGNYQCAWYEKNYEIKVRVYSQDELLCTR